MRILPVIESAAKATLLTVISAYRELISPYMPRACRFEPSCSKYAYEAIVRHGVVRGCRLAMGRLLRCRPGGDSGFDPVP